MGIPFYFNLDGWKMEKQTNQHLEINSPLRQIFFTDSLKIDFFAQNQPFRRFRGKNFYLDNSELEVYKAAFFCKCSYLFVNQ